MASPLLRSTGVAARVSRIGAVTSIVACSSASSVFSRRPTRAGVVHKDIKAAESGKSLFERRDVAFGGRHIRRYAWISALPVCIGRTALATTSRRRPLIATFAPFANHWDLNPPHEQGDVALNR